MDEAARTRLAAWLTAAAGAPVAIEAMKFIAPMLLQDIISVYAHVERKGRTSMPSWDEIVFGARTDD